MISRALFDRARSYGVMVGCWTVLMCSSIGASPYDIMVGCWIGKSDVYSPKGEYQQSVPSVGGVYWRTPQRLLHFWQGRPGSSEEILAGHPLREAVLGSHDLDFDLDVTGKYAVFRSPDKDVTGTETRTNVYHFLLNFKAGRQVGNWYNNHYFTGRNQRHVLGSFEPAGQHGEILFVAAQTLKRVPCGDPQRYERERKR